MQKINDAFSAIGNIIAEFKKEIKELTDITVVDKFSLTDKYTFMSVLSTNYEDADGNKCILTVVLNSDFISLFNTGAFFTMNTSEAALQKKLKCLRTIRKEYFPNRFYEEEIRFNDLMILNDQNKIMLISDEAYKTLLARINLSCDGMLQKSLARNILIAERLYYYEDVKSTVITRCNEKGYEKVMAVPSEKYTNVPQTILSEVIDGLEKTEKLKCMGYYVDNRVSYINLGFEEKEKEVRDVYKIADAVPGIYLASSDTGDCSITAKAFFQFGNSKAYIGEVTRRHEGKIDKNILLNDIKKALFPMYTEVPDKLIKLMAVEISNPVKAIKDALDYVHLTKLIGKKSEIVISEQLTSEISPVMKYTAYDIAMMCLQISDRIQNLSNDAKRKLEQGIIKVIDCDFSKSKTPTTATLAD